MAILGVAFGVFLAVAYAVLDLPRVSSGKDLHAGDGGFKRWMVRD
jgi:hypothetical protein